MLSNTLPAEIRLEIDRAAKLAFRKGFELGKASTPPPPTAQFADMAQVIDVAMGKAIELVKAIQPTAKFSDCGTQNYGGMGVKPTQSYADESDADEDRIHALLIAADSLKGKIDDEALAKILGDIADNPEWFDAIVDGQPMPATNTFADWVYEEGPRGGKRWKNSETGRYVYTKEKPGGTREAKQQTREEAHTRANEIIRNHIHAKATPDELRELLDHIPHLSHEQLSSVRARLMASFGGKRKLAERIEALKSHIQGLSDSSRKEKEVSAKLDEHFGNKEKTAAPFPRGERNIGNLDVGKGEIADTPVQKVPTNELHASQDAVNRDTVEHMMHGGKGSEKPVTVVKEGGKFHIEDGHHRATAAALNGEKEVNAKVIDLDAKKPPVHPPVEDQHVKPEDLNLDFGHEAMDEGKTGDVLRNQPDRPDRVTAEAEARNRWDKGQRALDKAKGKEDPRSLASVGSLEQAKIEDQKKQENQRKNPHEMSQSAYVAQAEQAARKKAGSWMQSSQAAEAAKKKATDEWNAAIEDAYLKGKPAADKPAWAKTGVEWANHPAGPGPMTDYHKGLVKNALAAGKPVPAEVLADYPDLAGKGGQPKPALPSARNVAESAPSPDEVGSLYDTISQPHVTEEHVQQMVDRIKGIKNKPAIREIGQKMDMTFSPNDTVNQMHEKISRRLLNVKRAAIKSNGMKQAAKNHEKKEAEKIKAEQDKVNAIQDKKNAAIEAKKAATQKLLDGLKDVRQKAQSLLGNASAPSKSLAPHEMSREDYQKQGEEKPSKVGDASGYSANVQNGTDQATAMNKIAPPVDHSLWTTKHALMSGNERSRGPDEHRLTHAGATLAFNVANKDNLSGKDLHTLESMVSGGQLWIERREGAKVHRINGEHFGPGSKLISRGYVESVKGSNGEIGYVITQKGKEAIEAGYREQQELLNRVKAAHPLESDATDATTTPPPDARKETKAKRRGRTYGGTRTIEAPRPSRDEPRGLPEAATAEN